MQTTYCPRCNTDVPFDAPWPHWRRVRNFYYASILLLVAAGPIISVDYCVMIPSTIVYLTAWGPLNGLVDEKKTCRKCGGIVP